MTRTHTATPDNGGKQRPEPVCLSSATLALDLRSMPNRPKASKTGFRATIGASRRICRSEASGWRSGFFDWPRQA